MNAHQLELVFKKLKKQQSFKHFLQISDRIYDNKYEKRSSSIY